MTHTYLFELGAWNARGVLVDACGEQSRITGSSAVFHDRDNWRIDGAMKVVGDLHEYFTTSYCITPFGVTGQTNWSSTNSTLGNFSGTFLVVKDSILSTGESKCGSFVVSEWLLQIDTDRYVNRGVLLKDGERVSSWALELERRLEPVQPLYPMPLSKPKQPASIMSPPGAGKVTSCSARSSRLGPSTKVGAKSPAETGSERVRQP